MDLGCGDGRAVSRLAGGAPETLVIGVDANASAMAEASRRAARSSRKGGLPNALFVVAAAESLPAELCHVAGEVRILFPWGSLLRGVLGLDDAVAAGLTSLLEPGGALTAYLSVASRDRIDGVACLDDGVVEEVRCRLAARGLIVEGADVAPAEEVAGTGSSWGRRLAVDPERAVWRLRARRMKSA